MTEQLRLRKEQADKQRTCAADFLKNCSTETTVKVDYDQVEHLINSVFEDIVG